MAIAFALATLAASACAGAGASQPCAGGARPVVVAAENFWGSIAAQIGGDRTCTASVIANPSTDPHAYVARPADARLVASARYVIVNGAGYDPWISKLLAANPVAGRAVLDIGAMLGKRDGDNPHLWYSPDYVGAVVDRIAADLGTVDSAERAYFQAQARQYRAVALRDYSATIAAIRQRYAGTPVGATESIFAYLAGALGLDLLTPPAYLRAISEGADPSPADRAEVEREITSHAIRVLVYNSQNSTRDVLALVARAKAQGIPAVTITETLAPASTTFQDWQTAQLRALLAALGG